MAGGAVAGGASVSAGSGGGGGPPSTVISDAKTARLASPPQSEANTYFTSKSEYSVYTDADDDAEQEPHIPYRDEA